MYHNSSDDIANTGIDIRTSGCGGNASWRVVLEMRPELDLTDCIPLSEGSGLGSAIALDRSKYQCC